MAGATPQQHDLSRASQQRPLSELFLLHLMEGGHVASGAREDGPLQGQRCRDMSFRMHHSSALCQRFSCFL